MFEESLKKRQKDSTKMIKLCFPGPQTGELWLFGDELGNQLGNNYAQRPEVNFVTSNQKQ